MDLPRAIRLPLQDRQVLAVNRKGSASPLRSQGRGIRTAVKRPVASYAYFGVGDAEVDGELVQYAFVPRPYLILANDRRFTWRQLYPVVGPQSQP